MNKITVVIPTMWSGDSLEKLLNSLQSVERIDEIIIIDNSPENINVDLSLFSKINHVKMEHNIYVNPSWNYGTKISKNEIVTLMQDDIYFNVEFLESINVYDDCLIGIDRKNYPPFTSEYNPTLEISNSRDWGFATILIYKKQSYIEIPEDLKIWCGDDFLFNKFKNRMVICGLPIETKMSVTAMLPIFDDIRNKDVENYEKYK